MYLIVTTEGIEGVIGNVENKGNLGYKMKVFGILKSGRRVKIMSHRPGQWESKLLPLQRPVQQRPIR